MSRRLPLIAIAGTILFLTVYGAGIYPWTVCVALLAFSTTGLVMHRKLDATPLPQKRRLTLPALYASLLIFIAIVLIPLPLTLTRLTGSHRFEQNRRVVETLAEANALALEAPSIVAFSTTRSRAGTLRALLLFATLFGAWNAARRMTAPQRLLWLRLLIGLGSIVAVLGHLSKWVIPQGDTLWWIIHVSHGLPGPVGGFVNPNHFAGFIAMLAPVALATGIADARQKRWGHTLADAAGFSLMTLALLFSMSRGGLVAYAGGMGVLTMLFFARSKRWGRLALTAAISIILGAAILLAFQHDQVRERLLSLRSPATTASLQARMGAWKDTAGMLTRYPIVGVGPNAFLATYPQHRTSSSRAARDFAENEYVQIMGETGIIGSALLVLFLVILVRQSRRALKEPQDEAVASCALACVGALTVAVTHALVDFPLHLPLYAITAATLVGCLWPERGNEGGFDASRWPHIIAFAIAILMLGLGPAGRLDSSRQLSLASTPQLFQTLTWAPTSTLAWRRLCADLFMSPSEPVRRFGERCLTQAADYDPNNYPLLRRLGDVRQALGDNRGANEAYRRVEALRDWIKLPVLPED